MGKRKSWVWDYAKRDGDRAFCDLCDGESNNEYSCVGGTTGYNNKTFANISWY